MDMLNSRPDELQEGLPAERTVFESTFRSVEADGSTWIYHVALTGEESSGLDETLPVDADHAAYSRSVKEPGWEELEPQLMRTHTRSPTRSDETLGIYRARMRRGSNVHARYQCAPDHGSP